jgi:hypothetical protein
MQWEGVPLYEWATRFNPSSREVFQVLAQVARALEATHAVGGLHRDIKGENIRVSPTGPTAFLTDYGAGTYEGAPPLTREGFAPGTMNYRSPEAWEFELHRPRNAPAAYEARPADDVFALGVSAYFCVTGVYPPPVEVREEESGPGSLVWTAPRPPRELNSRVDPGLSDLILRMLSEKPEERPTASELVVALEGGAKRRTPGVSLSLFEPKQGESSATEAVMSRPRDQEPEQAGTHARWALGQVQIPAWMASCVVIGGLLVAMAAGWGLRSIVESLAPNHVEEERRVARPVGVGDTSLSAHGAQMKPPAGQRRVGRPMPKEPLEGQRRAPNCQPQAPDRSTWEGRQGRVLQRKMHQALQRLLSAS